MMIARHIISASSSSGLEAAGLALLTRIAGEGSRGLSIEIDR